MCERWMLLACHIVVSHPLPLPPRYSSSHLLAHSVLDRISPLLEAGGVLLLIEGDSTSDGVVTTSKARAALNPVRARVDTAVITRAGGATPSLDTTLAVVCACCHPFIGSSGGCPRPFAPTRCPLSRHHRRVGK